MTDVVDRETRRRMMAGIRGKNTRPEMQVRKFLHHRGFRFRLHARKLPGHPDLVLPMYRAAIFVHGCFWHGHTCRYFKLPRTRTEFWSAKIRTNIINDIASRNALVTTGWRVLTVWECALRGQESAATLNAIALWLTENLPTTEITADPA